MTGTAPRPTLARTAGIACTACIALLVAVQPLRAQSDGAADAGPASVLDGVYTEAQADRGRTTFENVCSSCHGTIEFTMSSFMQSWNGARLYDLYGLLSSTMPADNPGGLEPQEYADVMARLLELNELPAGDRELPARPELLRSIRIERPPDDGPLRR